LDRIRRAEGVVIKEVPVVGTIKEVLDLLCDGLASQMSYQGIHKVSDLSSKGIFDLPQTPAGKREGVKNNKSV